MWRLPAKKIKMSASNGNLKNIFLLGDTHTNEQLNYQLEKVTGEKQMTGLSKKKQREYYNARNIALVHDGKIIKIYMVSSRRQIVERKLVWRKLYGPLFRKCEIQINFNQ